jgi:energy-coupling factor transport system ATP-binding protein
LLYRLGKAGCTVPEGVLNEEECVAALELLLNE